MKVDLRQIAGHVIEPAEIGEKFPGAGVLSHACVFRLSRDGVYAKSIQALAGDPDQDECVPASRFCTSASEHCVSVVCLHPGEQNVLGYYTISFYENKPRAPYSVSAELALDMVFVDAEYRGCSLGNTMAASICSVAEKVARELLSEMRGGGQLELVFSADPISPGGEALSDRVEARFDEMEEAREEAAILAPAFEY